MIGIVKNVIIKILQEGLDVIDVKHKKLYHVNLVIAHNHSLSHSVNKHHKIVV